MKEYKKGYWTLRSYPGNGGESYVLNENYGGLKKEDLLDLRECIDQVLETPTVKESIKCECKEPVKKPIKEWILQQKHKYLNSKHKESNDACWLCHYDIGYVDALSDLEQYLDETK